MAESPPIHSFTTAPEFERLYSAELLSNLTNTYPRLHEPHFPPRQHYAPDWQPVTTSMFNTQNTSPWGIFPPTPISPGQNPDQTLLFYPQQQYPSHATSDVNLGKRKWATPLSSGKTPLVGGYGLQSSGGTATDTSSLSPSLPLFTSDSPRNVALNVWAFTQALMSNELLPTNQWLTSTEVHPTKKLRT